MAEEGLTATQFRHRQHNKIRKANWKARRRGLPATLGLTEWRQTLAFFDYRCAYCGADLMEVGITIDHVTPLAEGGGTTQLNCLPCCTECNFQKEDHHFVWYILVHHTRSSVKILRKVWRYRDFVES